MNPRSNPPKRSQLARKTPLRRTPMPKSGAAARRLAKKLATKRPLGVQRRHTGPSARIRSQVLMRAGGRCERCHEPVGIHPSSVHHRIPRGMGGTSDDVVNTVAALVLLCGSGTTGCHGWVESHRMEAYATGWLIRRGVDSKTPETVPVADVTGMRWVIELDGTKELID